MIPMDIYMERIMELYKNPKNFGEIPEAEIRKTDYNPSCGDMVSMFAKVDRGRIIDAKFKGHGCAISTASASLLADYVKGKKLPEIESMGQKDIFALLGIDLSKNPSRVKCAMLPLTVLKQGIREIEK